MNTSPLRYLADIAGSPSFYLVHTPQLAEGDHGSCRWRRSGGHRQIAVRVVKPVRRDWIRPEHKYACADCAVEVARLLVGVRADRTSGVEWTEVREP